MVGIQTTARGVSGLMFLPREALQAARSGVARRAEAQLAAYFSDPAQAFDLPLDIRGSEFQLRVWRSLAEIPVGQPLTYGALAERLGSGARAVGNACRRNPLPLILPCHRVVAKSGPGGFAGSTEGGFAPIKQALLAHEFSH